MKALGAVAVVICGLWLAGHGYPVMLLGALVIAAVLWFGAGGSPKTVTGHSHGSDRGMISRHEAGHAIVIKATGGKVLRAAMGDDWGVVEADPPRKVTPVQDVAFYAGGQLAVGTQKGCAYDNKQIDKVLRKVPSRDRARVRKEGFDLARKIVSSRPGEIKRFAQKLERKGSHR